ncbi:type II toxin-antitoxin system RelE/ParE family toxin [Rhizobium sp. CG5]|uniref:type II toxin-antitoxin system RelE/ParE family toxin n=1 Tax=Rhizobium sp. CG5 TaxID=2726076 RepID=UPI002033EA22|nr:type II toxin-antitoxin system RelE/ParE family toxin [Rhizobium sp. CG5]MCM2474807.1 type II toxin-antitoxin system RelE/ParE family toxin [Rhizobium sp. CG5]
MIKGFKDKRTEQLFLTSKARGLPTEIVDRARRKLMMLNAANSLDDLRVPPSNRLELLKAERAGQHSIRINDQWRICFRWLDGDALDVEICDYH